MTTAGSLDAPVTARARSLGCREPPSSAAATSSLSAGARRGHVEYARPAGRARARASAAGEYARPAEGEAHADAAALDGDDEYSRLRAAASVFVELQEEEEHSFKSLLEKEVL